MRIEDTNERKFYENETLDCQWSARELQRQYNTGLYHRIILSKDKKTVLELAQKGLILTNPRDAVKDPYILEFLGLPEKSAYSESDLESQILEKLELFLLELGKGYTFVARQQRINIDSERFYIDLVFYNRMLRCFVIIDLKIGKLKHQDIGQIQMYVNYYDRKIKLPDENKTIGIILCQDKNERLVEITLPEGNDQIFASKYKVILPTKEDLLKVMEPQMPYGLKSN